MEVILLENIRNVGAFGAKVRVAKGYGRNYLIPQGKALPATEANMAVFEARRSELEAKAKARVDAAQQRADVLTGLTVTIPARVSEEGRLYGSVATTEIVNAVNALGHDVERNEVRLPEGPIHHVGEYDVVLSLHAEVEIAIHVLVVSDKEPLDAAPAEADEDVA